jgi:hypothetical protein
MPNLERLRWFSPRRLIYGAPRWKRWSLAAVFSVAAFLVIRSVHWWFGRQTAWVLDRTFADVLAAAILGLMALKLVNLAEERRRATLERLRMIGDMNHHIRNALEVIAMSAHGIEDKQAIMRINAAVDRIQWALREILPQGKSAAGERRRPEKERRIS